MQPGDSRYFLFQVSAMNELIEQNRREYGADYARLRFVDEQTAQRARQKRAELLQRLGPDGCGTAGGSKVHSGPLSPGCRQCIEGRWSCLFINGRCNAACFYCPTRQDELGDPTTNTVPFHTPQDYVDYVAAFGFGGVSLSGGEPLLTPDRSLAYLDAVKKRFGSTIHTWLYTNGILVNERILKQLRDAGLDEIRFDIGATGYRLDRAQLAVGIIPTVTVEVPAVPEEKERLAGLLVPMAEAGINHLNLHQLRLTPHNLPQLVSRGYHFLHGKKVTVLESELCALDLVAISAARHGVPVNYCSFVYKNRYQHCAARTRNARFAAKGWEEMTATGYLRTLTLHGSAEQLRSLNQTLKDREEAPDSFALNRAGDRLQLHPRLLPTLELQGLDLLVSYVEAAQLPAVTYRHPFFQVRVNDRKAIIIERRELVRDYNLGPASNYGNSPLPGELCDFETLPSGLADYF